eukprot:m.92062 g.92062  ORF g.92062 m.92062 type:complete len:85 (+) comp12008_c0_seq2:480-734(+)
MVISLCFTMAVIDEAVVSAARYGLMLCTSHTPSDSTLAPHTKQLSMRRDGSTQNRPTRARRMSMAHRNIPNNWEELVLGVSKKN